MANESMNRVQGHYQAQEESAKPMLEQYTEAAQTAMQEYPIGVTLGFFAAGLGLGVMVGAALAAPMGLRHQRTAENLGRKILDSIHDYLPESVQRQLHI